MEYIASRFTLCRPPLGLLRTLFCLACLACASLAAQAREIVINVDSGSEPTQYENDKGQAQGIYPEILRLSFARMGVPVNIQSRPFRRLITELNNGSAAAGAYIRTPERERLNDFSAPYFTEHVAVYHLGSETPFGTLADLKGKRVGVISGWSYGKEFDQAVRDGEFVTEGVGRDWQNFEKLLRGRLDYVIATELAGRVWLLRNAESGIQQGRNHLLSTGIHLAFSKQARQKELLAQFDRSTLALRQSGDIDRVVLSEVQRSAGIKVASSAAAPAARR